MDTGTDVKVITIPFLPVPYSFRTIVSLQTIARKSNKRDEGLPYSSRFFRELLLGTISQHILSLLALSEHRLRFLRFIQPQSCSWSMVITSRGYQLTLFPLPHIIPSGTLSSLPNNCLVFTCRLTTSFFVLLPPHLLPLLSFLSHPQSSQHFHSDDFPPIHNSFSHNKSVLITSLRTHLRASMQYDTVIKHSF